MADTKGITYVRMMLDVLTKKEVYLKDLLTLTAEQEKILKLEEFDEESFNSIIKQKDGIIKKLEELDNGFQAVYNRVAQELTANKEAYKEQILKMQGLISSVTDLGVKLTALEEKNRASLELLFQGRKNNIRQFKIGKQAADKYYKNMIGLTSEKSYFMDHKK